MMTNTDEVPNVEHVKVWQCIGCGKIEAPQPCIGVCDDRRVELVYADEHDRAISQLTEKCRNAESNSSSLASFLRYFTCTTPRTGEWEKSYRALQTQARQLLSTLTASSAASPHLAQPTPATVPIDYLE